MGTTLRPRAVPMAAFGEGCAKQKTLAALALASWGLLTSCSSPTLPVEFWGCESIKSGPVCLLGNAHGQPRTLKMLVSGAADFHIIFKTDAGEPQVESRASADLYVVTLPPKATWLQARLDGGGWGGPSYLLRLEELAQPSWLRAAHDLRYRDQLVLSEQTIREHLGEQLPLMVRAWAQGELGRSLREQHRAKEALVEMRHAIELDRQSGLLLDEARDVFLTAEILLDERRGAAVEQLLEAHMPVLDSFIENRPWIRFYRARALQLRGEHQAALRILEQGESIARTMQDLRAEPTLSALRASILVDLGRAEQADHLVANAAALLSGFPCRKGLLLEMQAAMRLAVLESVLGDGALQDERALASLWRQWEGEACCATAAPTAALRHDARLLFLLRQSQDTLAGGCAQPQYLAKVLLTQARLALLMGRNADSAHALQAAERILDDRGGAENVPAHNLLWATLKARLALAQGQTALALSLFGKLEQIAHDGDDPYEARWRAVVGRAQVWLHEGQEQKALDAMRQSQLILKERARNTSPLVGRVSFLDRFTWSTRLLVEALYKARKLEEALQTIRSTRVMALEELRVLSKLSVLTPAQRQQWNAAIDRYYETRLPLDKTGKLDGNDAAQLYRHQRQAEALQAAMQILGQPLGELPTRLPEPGELLLTCHPLRTSWLCLAATQEGGRLSIAASTPSDLSATATPAELSAVLLQPFAALLLKSRVVTVLASGVLRGIAVHMLPWGEGLLGDQLTVRYSLDIPGLPPAAPPRCGTALVVVPQALEDQAALPLGAPLAERLKRSGFAPHLEMYDRRYAIGNSLPRSLEAVLRQELPHAAFTQLLSHGEFTRGNSWLSHLVLSPFTTLTAGDVLALGAVPPQVALISCESSASAEAVGGQEALGLAQAFLLRGSQEVLATTRKVSIQAGARVAQAVYDNWRCGQSLVDALQLTVHSLSADVAIAPELDAFQVLVR